jgi:hypothetical protein
MNRDDDLVEYRGSIRGLSGEEAREIPSRVSCSGCGTALIKVRKDTKKKRLKMEILTTVLPEFSHPGERLGVLTCNQCGAKTNFDLLMFGVR